MSQGSRRGVASGAHAIAERAKTLTCPSAQPEMAGAVAFGVIDHTADEPHVRYLERPLPVDAELLAMSAPLRPTEIFRFTAPCQTSSCSHWDGADCKLVDRIVDLIPMASLVMPSCRIRPDCRWHAQVGRSACLRCPHVVTQNERPSDEMREAATPKR